MAGPQTTSEVLETPDSIQLDSIKADSNAITTFSVRKQRMSVLRLVGS